MTNLNKCPKCRREQYFVCGNPTCVCQKSVPKGKRTQVIMDGDLLACPYCGFTANIDYWEERSIRAMLKAEGVKSFAELAVNQRPPKETK